MMAREVQAQSNRPQGGKAVLGLLANAVFWFIVAIAVPVEEFLRQIPETAPYAHWAPYVFYGLALWSFIRAIRGLQRLAASRMWTPRIRTAGASASSQPTGNKRARTAPTVAVTRPPTVQRMR
jgi:hypothetical protein